jgi:hypothetical protein
MLSGQHDGMNTGKPSSMMAFMQVSLLAGTDFPREKTS